MLKMLRLIVIEVASILDLRKKTKGFCVNRMSLLMTASKSIHAALLHCVKVFWYTKREIESMGRVERVQSL